jgi:hypothetical protein
MAIYGAQLFKTPTNGINYTSDFAIGTNSEVFTSGEPVTVTSGLLTIVGATSAVAGVIVKTATMASDNQTVALVKPLIIPVDQDYEWLMGTNANLSETTSIGVFYKLTGTTAAIQVDVNSGAQTTTNRVVVCTKVDPNGLGDLTQGLFKFVKVINVKSDE